MATLNDQSRSIISKVFSFFKKESKQPSNLPPGACTLRTSMATGVSERTVLRVVKEKENAHHPGTVTKKNRYKSIDNFDQTAIRNKILEFYTVRRQLPTLQNLLDALRKDLAYPGSRSHLHKTLHQLGFKWIKTKTQRKVLVEKQAVLEQRLRFYERKDRLQREGFQFVFVDETWIDTGYTANYCWQSRDTDGVLAPIGKGQRLIVVHAGSESGFIPGARLVYKASATTGDYHHEMNGEKFMKWMTERLLPNLQQKSAIVLDNASYHSVKSDKCPTSSTRKADIQKWLIDHGIMFDPRLLRPQLLQLVRQNKPEPSYVLENLVQASGHEVLRLPPYHPDLNAIELIWSQVKRAVQQRNVTHRLDDVLKLAHASLDEIGEFQWRNACAHAEKCENDYRRRDIVVDSAMDRLVIDLADSSDNDTDSEATDTASETEEC